jgi:hypothetical protein
VAGALLAGVWGGTEVGAQHLFTRTLVDTRFAGATIVLTLQGRSTRSSVSIAAAMPDRVRHRGGDDRLAVSALPPGSAVSVIEMRLSDTPAVIVVERRIGSPATSWGLLAAEAEGWELGARRRLGRP